jgi:hypothetical protein
MVSGIQNFGHFPDAHQSRKRFRDPNSAGFGTHQDQRLGQIPHSFSVQTFSGNVEIDLPIAQVVENETVVIACECHMVLPACMNTS